MTKETQKVGAFIIGQLNQSLQKARHHSKILHNSLQGSKNSPEAKTISQFVEWEDSFITNLESAIEWVRERERENG